MKEKALYFIALVPEEPLFSQVMNLKHHFKEKYQSRKALKSPPHITLQMPFKWREDREEHICDMLSNVTGNFHKFQLSLNGFGYFEPRVIYIDVEKSEDLFILYKELARTFRETMKLVNELGERPFQPHLTIAFRDLKKPMFYQARDEFTEKEFKAEFKVNDICLLKHNGSSWDIYERLELIKS